MKTEEVSRPEIRAGWVLVLIKEIFKVAEADQYMADNWAKG